jgi:hypothetical protein
MHFKEIEGKFITTLPKDKGLAAAPVMAPDPQEVRIVLCAGGDTRAHVQSRAEHEKGAKDPAVCRALVDKTDCGELRMTDGDAERLEANRAAYRRIGERAKELYDMAPSSRDPGRRTPVVIDADSETPYEHIIGVINVLKEHEIDSIEFAANPRFGTMYGRKK